MARPRQLTRYVLCAVLAAAVCASAAVATAASTKRKPKPKHPAKTACVVRRPPTGSPNPSKRVQRTRKVHHTKRRKRVVRCTRRVTRRRAKVPAKRPAAHAAPR